MGPKSNNWCSYRGKKRRIRMDKIHRDYGCVKRQAKDGVNQLIVVNLQYCVSFRCTAK